MTIERFTVVAMTAISIASFFYIPKAKYRLALVSFLISGATTWAASLSLVQFGLVEYPVRVFIRATRGNFMLMHLFVPTVVVWFILTFPYQASIVKKILHYFIFTSFFTWFTYFTAMYTNLEKMLKVTMLLHVVFMYIRYSSFLLVNYIYISWFSKKANLSKGQKRHA